MTTQQRGGGCGWLTKWVALPLISSPCLLPKQSRSKWNQVYLPTLQADPQLRQTRMAIPLFREPLHTKFLLAYTPTPRSVNVCTNSLEQLRKKYFCGTCVGAMPFLRWFCFVVCGVFLHKVSYHYSSWDYHIMRLKVRKTISRCKQWGEDSVLIISKPDNKKVGITHWQNKQMQSSSCTLYNRASFSSYLFIADPLLLLHLGRHSSSFRKGMELAWKKIGKKSVSYCLKNVSASQFYEWNRGFWCNSGAGSYREWDNSSKITQQSHSAQHAAGTQPLHQHSVNPYLLSKDKVTAHLCTTSLPPAIPAGVRKQRNMRGLLDTVLL